MTLKILFLTPYPLSTAPSQRFRFEQYYKSLEESNILLKSHSFINYKTWKILYLHGKNTQKALGIIKGFLRRFLLLFSLYKYNYIFIHREASPIGPPIFEWMIAKVFRKKIIYDFDDAIWIPNTSEQNKIAAALKWHHKVSSICKWSYKVSVGNEYLAEYARQYNKNVVVNPTTIDTENVHNLIKEHNQLDQILKNQEVPGLTNSHQLPPLGGQGVNKGNILPLENQGVKTIIGWTGSHSTLQYINEIIPILQQLEQQYNIEFQVISNQDPELPLKHYKFIKWKKEKEIEDLVKFDIGIMPLTEDKWAKGKCGFKALQYMALGIPPLVSPVGVNTTIVQHGENGFICSTQQDWLEHIKQLIENAALRKSIGQKARKTIEEKYSVKSNTRNFLNLFT